VRTGDCLAVLATMPAGCVDAVVCDPPYGLSGDGGKTGFMGLAWDHGVPGAAYWQAVRRVCRPGAHLLAFGGTRTFHRLAVALEAGGWELRDTLCWLYGQGFPKSLDVGKAIDRAAGAVRETVGPMVYGEGKTVCESGQGRQPYSGGFTGTAVGGLRLASAPATAGARQWDGWGTALKPAWEPILLARAPLDGTVAANVLAHGTGGINVDGCRIGTRESTARPAQNKTSKGCPGCGFGHAGAWGRPCVTVAGGSPLGRWPSNVCHDGSAEVLAGLPVVATAGNRRPSLSRKHTTGIGFNTPARVRMFCIEEKTSSAARFFYCAKASRRDRDEGCEGLPAGNRNEVYGDGLSTATKLEPGKHTPEGVAARPRRHNLHPTVKPTALMRWLCRLVLDPFAGSGSTGKAALLEGFRVILIEREPQYAEIARARCAWAAGAAARAGRGKRT